MPNIALPPTRNNHVLKVHPCLSYQVRLFVVVENRNFQLVVVRRVVNSKSKLLVPEHRQQHTISPHNSTHHLGVWPPRRSVSVFFASFPSLAAQYGSCLPIVFRFGKFFARSTIITNVPISGPSTVISEYIPAVCMPLKLPVFGLFAILCRGRVSDHCFDRTLTS